MKGSRFLLAVLALVSAAALVQCATGNSSDLASGDLAGTEGFYAEMGQVRQQIAAAPDAPAKMGLLLAYRDSLRKKAAAYDQSVTNGKVSPADQQIYNELLGLLLTLNNFPDKVFNPDYCEIIRYSIGQAWAPNDPAPDPQKFPRPAREGLAFLDLFCANQ